MISLESLIPVQEDDQTASINCWLLQIGAFLFSSPFLQMHRKGLWPGLSVTSHVVLDPWKHSSSSVNYGTGLGFVLRSLLVLTIQDSLVACFSSSEGRDVEVEEGVFFYWWSSVPIAVCFYMKNVQHVHPWYVWKAIIWSRWRGFESEMTVED